MKNHETLITFNEVWESYDLFKPELASKTVNQEKNVINEIYIGFYGISIL